MSWTSFGAADQIKPWVKRAVTIASFMLLLASARDASAACQNGAAAQTVPLMTGPALIDIITASHPPCTLSLNPGTYAAAASGPQSGYTISEGITLRAANG